MKTLFPVQVLRRLIGGAAITGLALGSTLLLTACEPDPPPPSPPPEQAERPAQPTDPARPADDRVTRDDPALRDDPTRQDDPMTRDDRRVTQDDPMMRDDQRMGQDRDPAIEPRTLDDETLQAMSTEDLVGSSVRSRIEDEEIGTIEDVLIDAQGNPVGVVVSVGEFLDTDEKLVALEWSRISLEDPTMQPGARGAAAGDQPDMEDRDFTIIVDATREELENAPEFDREAWEREQEQARAGNAMDNGY